MFNLATFIVDLLVPLLDMWLVYSSCLLDMEICEVSMIIFRVASYRDYGKDIIMVSLYIAIATNMSL